MTVSEIQIIIALIVFLLPALLNLLEKRSAAGEDDEEATTKQRRRRGSRTRPDGSQSLEEWMEQVRREASGLPEEQPRSKRHSAPPPVRHVEGEPDFARMASEEEAARISWSKVETTPVDSLSPEQRAVLAESDDIPIDPVEDSTRGRRSEAAPRAASARRAVRESARSQSQSKSRSRQRFRLREGDIRRGFILREVLGPPKGLDP